MSRISILLSFLFLIPLSSGAEVLRVGPHEALRSISEASLRAHDGDVIEVAAGEYPGDVAVWTQSDITVRAVGGMARLTASGMSAEGKGIWVVRGRSMTVENMEFVGARVRDRNGAGIRLERGTLTVRNCRFLNNENGILTGNDGSITLNIENSEFGGNGDGSGQTHNLYAGKIARLFVEGSYFHNARAGHLLKSRAALNLIYYNRLTDEPGGTASYELEFPAGGQALVVGNLIEQSGTTDNSTIISYGAEGAPYPANELYLSHNTIFDDRTPAGRYLDVRIPAHVSAYNNVLAGDAKWVLPAGSVDAGTIKAGWEDFALPVRQDYRPRKQAAWLNKGVTIPADALSPALRQAGYTLVPTAEYLHPLQVRKLPVPAIYPGAQQSVVP